MNDPIRVRAAVLHRMGEPMSVEDVLLDAPGPEEVRVRVAAAGVCHSDLHLAEGHLGPERVPIVLGHEGAGVVEAVGPDVTGHAPGDPVAFCFVPACGACRQCIAGRRNLCELAGDRAWKGTMPDGTTRLRTAEGERLLHFNFVSCFAESCVVPVASAVPLPAGMQLWKAALVGCGVVTAFGAVQEVAHVRSPWTAAGRSSSVREASARRTRSMRRAPTSSRPYAGCRTVGSIMHSRSSVAPTRSARLGTCCVQARPP